MVGRNPARYLAPIALVAAIAGTCVIVDSRLSAKPAPVHHASTHRETPGGKFASTRFYAIQPGDNLSRISIRTDVPVPTLEALNPSLDPNALQSGQRLRLKR